MISDCKGKTVFNVVKNYLNENNNPLKNLIACATDGAPAIVGNVKGVKSFLKKEIPDIFFLHCMIHRYNLISKNSSDLLYKSLQTVVKAINIIKTSPLRSRIFKTLCNDNNEEYNNFLMHTEIRWLSRGKCMEKVCQLFETIVQFLDASFPQLSNNLCKKLQYFLSDIFIFLIKLI